MPANRYVARVPLIVLNGAGCPKVDMQDEERTGDGPREDQLLVLASVFVSQHTVGAHAHPRGDIATHFGPEEAKAQPMQRFEFFHVASNGAGVIGAKQVPAKGGGYNNEGEYLASVADGLECD